MKEEQIEITDSVPGKIDTERSKRSYVLRSLNFKLKKKKKKLCRCSGRNKQFTNKGEIRPVFLFCKEYSMPEDKEVIYRYLRRT